MMGLEPTTFCMANGSGDLTSSDDTYEDRVVKRNRSEGVRRRRAVSGQET